MATRPILNLDTLTNSSPVIIDGERYTLRRVDALSIFQSFALEQSAERFNTLRAKGMKMSRDELKEFAEALQQIVPAVLEAPEAVHVRLSDSQRVDIVEHFLQLSQPMPPLMTRAPKTAPASTGANRSRGSSGSSAAHRSRG